MGEWRGRFFYQHYLAQRREHDKLSALDDVTFVRSRSTLRSEFLPRRSAVLRKIHALVKAHGGRVYFLTQPHAYREDYKPFREDLRLFPVVSGKRANRAQAAGLMFELNEHTRRMARELRATLIDVDQCIHFDNPSLLFYDSVHYSVEGSRAVAKCVQQGLDAPPP